MKKTKTACIYKLNLGTNMKLASLIDENLIFWDFDLTNHEQIYDFMSEKISQKYNVDKKEIYNAILKRERISSTVYDGGFAIPHGRLTNFKDLIISIYKPQKPVDVDGKEAKIFVLILTTNSGSNLYLKTLSAFAKIFTANNNLVNKIESKSDFVDFIKKSNIDVTKTLKVKDIMNKNIFIAKETNLISLILDDMVKKNLTIVPVGDPNGIYLGEISINNILHIGYPDYVLSMNGLSFLNNFRAFEQFSNLEKTALVSEFYTKDTEQFINQNETIIELGFKILKHKWNRITVVDDNKKILGTVGTKEILLNVLRA